MPDEHEDMHYTDARHWAVSSVQAMFEERNDDDPAGSALGMTLHNATLEDPAAVFVALLQLARDLTIVIWSGDFDRCLEHQPPTREDIPDLRAILEEHRPTEVPS